MKRFTDEQIIEIFKYCNESDCDDCYNCTARQDGKCAIPDLGAQVVQVINRQKAEIEKLNIELKAMRGAANSYKLELERKEDELHRAKVEISKHFDYLDEAANEAIKEFAERLKRYSFVDNLSLDGKQTVYIEDIDNLTKEMTEEEK